MLDPNVKGENRATLSALVDTLVPASGPTRDFPPYPAATSAGVDRDAEALVLGLPEELRSQFDQLLSTVNSRLLNLFLTGRPVRFAGLDPKERERYLRSWAGSRLAAKRRGF